MRIVGKCSWFGGPHDLTVQPDEGLALCSDLEVGEFDSELFLPHQPPGTTGLARRLNPDALYIACRWDYRVTPRDWLQSHGVTVVNNHTGASVGGVQPIDWGPSEITNRIADLSPGVLKAIGLVTDNICAIDIPVPHLSLGDTPTGFATWIPFILEDEGAEVNESPDEPGGISKYGVSLNAMADYCKANNLPPPLIDYIRNLTEDNAKLFYAWFFAPMMLDHMPDAIAYRIADLVVTLGRTGAIEAVSVALGIWPIPTTMAGLFPDILKANQTALIWGLSGVWLATKRAQGGPLGRMKYAHGWTVRRNKVQTRSLAMVL
jgi:hypothetical protein